MDKYIEITKKIYDKYSEKHKKDVNVFYAVKTKDGRYVCSVNSIDDFPELFPDKPTIITLTSKDFPQVSLENL